MKAKVKTSLPARVVDISSRGVQLEIANSLRPQVPCDVRIQLADGEVTLRAMVRRCRAWAFGVNEADERVLLYRAGLEFGEIDPETLGRLSSNIFFDNPPLFGSAEEEPAQHASTLETESHNATPACAPQRGGPVKIPINAEHVRKILGGTNSDQPSTAVTQDPKTDPDER